MFYLCMYVCIYIYIYIYIYSCDFTCIHLMGTFYQTIHMLGHGIKPVYAFDGKPSQLKRRAEAENLLAQVQETGEQENIDKFSKRLCKKLLTLMGVPYIKAPCEAEASCTALVKAVVATATEDTDSLTFGAGVLLRHLTPIIPFPEVSVSVCLLGPLQKHPAPEDCLYKEARGLFLQPDIPNKDTLIQFMCAEKQFSEDCIKNSCKKMMKAAHRDDLTLFTIIGSLRGKPIHIQCISVPLNRV
uniref:XPG-I domain-containing protein n=1 Tax=Oncorhynchus mykiss TaxID=8022 RepID=A0A8K9UQH7_ONCMY